MCKVERKNIKNVKCSHYLWIKCWAQTLGKTQQSMSNIMLLKIIEGKNWVQIGPIGSGWFGSCLLLLGLGPSNILGPWQVWVRSIQIRPISVRTEVHTDQTHIDCGLVREPLKKLFQLKPPATTLLALFLFLNPTRCSLSLSNNVSVLTLLSSLVSVKP